MTIYPPLAGKKKTPFCPSPPPPPIPPPQTHPPPSATGVAPSLLRRRFHINRGLGAQAQPHDPGTPTFPTFVIPAPADSIGYPTTVTIDSVVGDSGIAAPFKESLDRAKRLVFGGRLAPGGEFRNAVPSDSVAAQALPQLLGRFLDFLPRIPRRCLPPPRPPPPPL